MELKEGMYVRTKYGIARIINTNFINEYIEDPFLVVDKQLESGLIGGNDENLCDRKDIIGEPSHNIIDLIEVGDVITYFISNKDTGFSRINNIEMLDRFKNGDKILSIVTKEQMESISYKVN